MSGEQLLSLIVDCNPVSWGRLLDKIPEETQFNTTLNALNDLTSFCNVHCLQNPANRLILLGAGLGKRRKTALLYSNETDSTTDVHSAVKSALTEAILSDNDNEEDQSLETRLAGPLTNAICYTNLLIKQHSGVTKLESRILIVKLCDDVTSQHLNLMSAFFAAQKQGIIVDACTVGYKSAILQQASDITGGICMEVPQLPGLLQYLLTVFLPDAVMREKMRLPSLGDVDYRPACFCHQELLSIGWVCSVCLSVFCKFTPICPTCQTAFKFLPALPKLKRRKKTK